MRADILCRSTFINLKKLKRTGHVSGAGPWNRDHAHVVVQVQERYLVVLLPHDEENLKLTSFAYCFKIPVQAHSLLILKRFYLMLFWK